MLELNTRDIEAEVEANKEEKMINKKGWWMQVKKHMKPAGRQTLGLLITNNSKQLHEMSNVTATAGPFKSWQIGYVAKQRVCHGMADNTKIAGWWSLRWKQPVQG